MNFIEMANDHNIQEEYKWFDKKKGQISLSSFPLNNINIVVGANNSRKSRFFRHIINNKHIITTDKITSLNLWKIEGAIKRLSLFFPKTDTILIKHNDTISFSPHQLESFPYLQYFIDFNSAPLGANRYRISFFEELIPLTKGFVNSNEMAKSIGVKKIQNTITIINLLCVYNKAIKNIPNITSYIQISTTDNIKKLLYEEKQQKELLLLKEALSEFLELDIKFITPKITYIPTLRGAMSLILNSRAEKEYINSKVYNDTIIDNYKLDKNSNLTLFTGLDLYKIIREARNSPRDTRLKFEKFEAFLKKNFFEGKNIDIVALDGKAIIQIFIEDSGDREIHNIGDGIQAIILLMYPLFIAEKGEWVFIEEPELNMHPGLQTLFLHTIINNEYLKEKNLKIFITTHSNHLLDTLLYEELQGVSIFSFEKIMTNKENYTEIREVLTPNNHVLDLLGVKNSSVFMANSAIWVEGISDRKYIQAFLMAYIRDNEKREYLEDIHYSFFEYAGSNLVHYLFDNEDENVANEKIKAHFLSNRIFLLSDKDSNEDEYKKAKHLELEALSHESEFFEYAHTTVIEVENLLSKSILKIFFEDFFKIEKIKIQRLRFTEKDYEDLRMGTFISKKINKYLRKKRNLKTTSGTLTTYYKNELSDYVLQGVLDKKIDWSMIKENEAAKDLTIKIYDFIQKQNVNR